MVFYLIRLVRPHKTLLAFFITLRNIICNITIPNSSIYTISRIIVNVILKYDKAIPTPPLKAGKNWYVYKDFGYELHSSKFIDLQNMKFYNTRKLLHNISERHWRQIFI